MHYRGHEVRAWIRPQFVVHPERAKERKQRGRHRMRRVLLSRSRLDVLGVEYDHNN